MNENFIGVNDDVEDVADSPVSMEQLEKNLIPEPVIPAMNTIIGGVDDFASTPEMVEPSVPTMDYQPQQQPNSSTPLIIGAPTMEPVSFNQPSAPTQTNPPIGLPNNLTPGGTYVVQPQQYYQNVTPYQQAAHQQYTTQPQHIRTSYQQPPPPPNQGRGSTSSQPGKPLYGKLSATEGHSIVIPLVCLIIGICLFAIVDLIIVPLLFCMNFIIPIISVIIAIFAAIIPLIPHIIGSLFIGHPSCLGKSLGYLNVACAFINILVILGVGLLAVGGVFALIFLLIAIVILIMLSPILLPCIILIIVFCAVYSTGYT